MLLGEQEVYYMTSKCKCVLFGLGNVSPFYFSLFNLIT